MFGNLKWYLSMFMFLEIQEDIICIMIKCKLKTREEMDEEKENATLPENISN